MMSDERFSTMINNFAPLHGAGSLKVQNSILLSEGLCFYKCLLANPRIQTEHHGYFVMSTTMDHTKWYKSKETEKESVGDSLWSRYYLLLRPIRISPRLGSRLALR